LLDSVAVDVATVVDAVPTDGREEVAAEPVSLAVPVVTVPVMLAPAIVKPVEKLTFVEFVSSMISKLYWASLTWFPGMMKVAVRADASTPESTMRPVSEVTPAPCCSLIVTVPLDGSLHVIVVGTLAVIMRPPGGILIAF